MNILQPQTIGYLAGIVGGPALVFGAFPKSYRNGSALLRTAIWFSGSLAVGWSVLGLTYWYRYYEMTREVRARVYQGKTTCGGGALALLLLLITSGEFWRLGLSSWPFSDKATAQPPLDPGPNP